MTVFEHFFKLQMLLNHLKRFRPVTWKRVHTCYRLSTSNSSNAAARETRRAARDKQQVTSSPKEVKNNSSMIAGGLVFALTTGYIIYENVANKNGQIATTCRAAYDWLYEQTFGRFAEVFEPISDRLLPDWGDESFYPGIPPGTPVPPLLIVDVEKTLIGSIHDARYGWRHVKRPGVDQFINQLSSYYEIVLFTEYDVNERFELLSAIDKENKCHKLGSQHAQAKGNLILKRLDKMNRDVRRTILIDDSPISSQLFPENTILVKPYTDINDKNDSILLELIPVLQAFVHEGVGDFRETLDRMVGDEHAAEEIVAEYFMRLSGRKAEEAEKRNKGLGGILRKRLLNTLQPDPSEPSQVKSLVKSPSQIVGEAPASTEGDKISSVDGATSAPVKKKGALFEMLEQSEKEREEMAARKMQRMNDIYMRKMQEKEKKQREEEARKQREI